MVFRMVHTRAEKVMGLPNLEYRDKKFIDHNDVAANDGIIKSLTKEARITSDAIMDWYNWLKHHGCEMKIISDLNPAPAQIQRVTL